MAARVEGIVTEINAAGDLLTDIEAGQLALAPRDASVTIRCDEHMTLGIYPSDHSEPEMTLLAVLPEDGCLRLLLVGDDAAKFLGIRVGSPVVLKW